MDEAIVIGGRQRRVWVAILFSLIMPGLGQVYCGKLARGLVLNFLNILPLPIIVGLFLMSNSLALMQITLALIAAGGIVQLLATIDSIYLARHTTIDYELKEYNRWYVYVLLILVVTGGSAGSGLYLRDQAVEAFIVPKASSYPAILPGDRILANKSAYKAGDPQLGDLVVFLNPENRHVNHIKRVVAVAGDTVEIKAGELYVNDKKLVRQQLAETSLDEIRIDVKGEPLTGEVFYETNGNAKYKIFMAQPPHDKTSGDFSKITVPQYHCFVLGDNRNMSCDSRHYGPVPLATIKGRADYLYYPAKDWSRFGRLK